ncbi:MAG TPA: IS3 family transposase [Clostridiaceae bacterium]|nr:IS3 family transposase [Clostridiaceae bacterium]
MILYNQTFNSVEHFVEELHEYIQYYNEERIRSCLGYVTPIEYRLLAG